MTMAYFWTGITENVLASALTGLAIFVANVGWRRWRNARVQKKYPVAGRYVTYYEDEKDGLKFMAKAPVVLVQHGYKIVGVTENLERHREWSIEGEIVGHGLLSGIYYPSSPHDPGRGTFFLEPNLETANEYIGIWAGYDSVNKEVRCGKYYWRKLTVPIITRISSENSERNSAFALLGAGMGNNYIDEAEFDGYLNGASDGIVLGACMDSQLSGVLLAKHLDKEAAEQFGTLAKNARSAVSLANLRLGILKSIVVKDEFRAQGIGTALSLRGIQHLKTMGCTAIIAFSWDSGEKSTSAGMLEAVGFHRISSVKECWKEDSIRRAYNCPRCGNPCVCDAILFLKIL
jgi:N-acetylglutamate synthase-like GNAT family acetyltransferase